MRENVVLFINITILRGENAEWGWSVISMRLACTWSSETCFPKWQLCLSKLLTSSGMCPDNQEPAGSFCQRTTLFSEERTPEMGQLGKTVLDNGYGFAPGAILCQPYGVEEDTCLRFTAPLKYWKRIIKINKTNPNQEKKPQPTNT